MVDVAERLAHLIPADRVAEFCRRWEVAELSLFGSVLRDDFMSDSDVDVLVSFSSTAPWSLWDLTAMEDELAAIVGRKVQLVEKEALQNPFRRGYILRGRKVIYVGAQG
ncbi:DNA polymerase subunit beta [Candidatus Kaiserbacteria bacterium]|nr:DNA polymerase subunit beta [Candidatus Kaiserbacteria bacterium]